MSSFKGLANLHPELVEIELIGLDGKPPALDPAVVKSFQFRSEVFLGPEPHLECVVLRRIGGGSRTGFGHLEEEMTAGTQHAANVAKVGARHVPRRVLK